MALDPSRAMSQPRIDPDPLSLPPPTLGVTSPPRVKPSPSPSCAPAPSPSPSSGYPPPSPGGASDEDLISVRSGHNGSELATKPPVEEKGRLTLNSDSEWKEKTVRDEREKQERDNKCLVILRDDMRQSAVCHRLKPSANRCVCSHQFCFLSIYMVKVSKNAPPGEQGGQGRFLPRGVVSTRCISLPPRSELRPNDLDRCCRCHQSVRTGSVLTTRDTCTSVEIGSEAVSLIGRGSPSFDSP